MEVAKSQIGDVIAERYKLQELLGEGGSGSTYRALRLTDQTTVAIKILSLRHLHDWKQLELFEREAKVLSQLDHPQIPKYLEYFHVDTPDNRAFYIVQQLAPGKPLTAWIQSGWRGTTAEIQNIASQILGILQYLHQQSPPLVHRDIKPHNIVRNDDGQVFLVDFGAVQDVYNHTLIRGSTVAGTYGYMAPEQFRGQAVPPSDLYGLGATLLYLLTHRSPAELTQERLKINFRSHVNIPEYFADWLEVMLEPDVAERFPTATKALAALQQQHRFRVQKGARVGFPWKSAAAAVAASCVILPIVHQYRYAFLTIVGLQPKDLCSSISNNNLTVFNEYLKHGGSPEVLVNVPSLGLGSDSNTHKSTKGSLLHCAINAGQANMVSNLLQRGLYPNLVDQQGVTPLYRAVLNYKKHIKKCAGGNEVCNPMYEIVTKLAKHGAEINGRSTSMQSYSVVIKNDESALFLAVRLRNYAAIKQLLELGADPNTQNSKRSNNWHSLAWNNASDDTGKIDTLQEYSSKPVENNEIANLLFSKTSYLSHQNIDANTPLYLAVISDNTSMVDFLLSKKVDTTLANSNGATPLTESTRRGKLDLVTKLLKAGASINHQDRNGDTALHHSFKSWSNNFSIMATLLENGADVNLRNQEGKSAVDSLVTSNINSADNMCIPTPHSSNSLKNVRNMLNLMVKKGADRQATSKNGNTALHRTGIGNLTLMKSLIAHGWQLSKTNHNGYTPLQIAASSHNISTAAIEQILSANFQVDQRDTNGNTMLHNAVITGDKSLIKVLMNLGASTQVINNHRQNQTPLSLARELAKASELKNSKERSISARNFINQCEIERNNTPKAEENNTKSYPLF
jgi:serine/threonine protein kinase